MSLKSNFPKLYCTDASRTAADVTRVIRIQKFKWSFDSHILLSMWVNNFAFLEHSVASTITSIAANHFNSRIKWEAIIKRAKVFSSGIIIWSSTTLALKSYLTAFWQFQRIHQFYRQDSIADNILKMCFQFRVISLRCAHLIRTTLRPCRVGVCANPDPGTEWDPQLCPKCETNVAWYNKRWYYRGKTLQKERKKLWSNMVTSIWSGPRGRQWVEGYVLSGGRMLFTVLEITDVLHPSRYCEVWSWLNVIVAGKYSHNELSDIKWTVFTLDIKTFSQENSTDASFLLRTQRPRHITYCRKYVSQCRPTMRSLRPADQNLHQIMQKRGLRGAESCDSIRLQATVHKLPKAKYLTPESWKSCPKVD